ncbi:6598_t:CDS:10 [Entrophospora sp. SA101]|nr:6598_t:CDS:10 [Entrophospora sp. SA101]
MVLYWSIVIRLQKDATLVGEKYLYVYGGRLLPVVDDQSIDEFIDGIDTTEILYLDVSVNFDLKNPAWNLLTADNLIAFHSMSIGGQNNNSLIIFGGMSGGNAPPNPLYIFDTTSKSKSLASKAVTTECTSRVLHTSVTKYDSKVFILGGSSIPVAGNTEVSDALNTLCVYDSLTDTVLGDNPPQRRGHRAVGTINKKIIIYGGRNADASIIYDDVLELDTTTLTWKIIQTGGIDKPPALFDHTMTMDLWKEKRHNSYFTTPYGLNQPYSPPLTGNLLFNQSPNYLTSNKNTPDRSTSSLPVPPPPLLPPSTLKNKNSSDSSKLTIVDPNDVHRNPPRKQFSIDDYLGNPYQLPSLTLPSLTLPSTLKNKNSFDSNKLTIDDPNDASRNSSYLQLMQANDDRFKASSIATSSIYTPSRSSSTGSSHIGSTRPKIDTQLNSITESGDVTPTKFTTTTSPSSDIIAAINAAAKSDSRSSEEGSFQSPLFKNEILSLRTATRLSKMNPNDHVDHDVEFIVMDEILGLRNSFHENIKGYANHVLDCPPRSADTLVRNAFDDKMPTKMAVLHEYGFNNCINPREQSMLFGLYIGLIKIIGCSASQIHSWWEKGKLSLNIKTAYDDASATGGYYDLFLRNEHLLQGLHKYEGEKSDKTLIDRHLAMVKPYLSEHDQTVSIKSLPESKREVAIFYIIILTGCIPRIEQQSWIDFGFCSCKFGRDHLGETEEIRLSELYWELIVQKGCKIDEFNDAYMSGSVVDLLKKKCGSCNWLSESKIEVRGYRQSIRSVYSLKQYALNESVEFAQGLLGRKNLWDIDKGIGVVMDSLTSELFQS